ncbi:ABC transporter ATP-binding protein ['Fragaria x ananassa' phyllody phytoplasma]|uniref:ABC transporter ATP-binding protein n=1 Tax='Fragaria x ananassa' phyllody phytoplasma TaxID=2358428 RepID=A0ABS5K317_9MOLU|nr:ABC transporter ATP-binding protein ['Fragaria x ananassa' phyllody phytoplasma]MBS2126149.1 ABC transporter ATP-binding protein ['Fragaria x ananassa' phyllody phytoplasma]
MKYILKYLKPFKTKIIISICLILIVTAVSCFIPFFEGKFITDSIKNQIQSPKITDFTKHILQVLILNLLLYLFIVICRLIFNKLLIQSIHQSMCGLRQDVQRKIHNLPIKYFDQNTLGNIMSRITNDIEVISNCLQQSFSIMISAFLLIFMIISFMFVLHWFLACIVFIMIPLSFYTTYCIFKNSQKVFIQRFESTGNYNGFLQEKYTGYKEIILYNQQKATIKEFNEYNTHLQQLIFKSNFLSGLSGPIVSLFTYLTLVVVSITGYFLIQPQTPNFLMNLGLTVIKIGLFRTFLQYVWRLGNPIIELGHMSVLIQSANAASKRVFSFLNEIEEAPEVTNPLVLPKPEGQVIFENVSFSYNNKDMLLRNISFTAEKGQTIAIVGPTGSGKSTLINLLMRFYDVNLGSIQVDGIDIRKLKKDNLRSIFGMVLQETWFFKDTIWKNIKYGNQQANDEEVLKAAEKAQVNYFIKNKPGEYQMVINEEADNLSQGEKQLITIARTVLSNPKILILDEATSNVDTRIEILLQKAINKLIQNKTSFVIAHRLSTIINADKILVLNRGVIIEQGTHQQLLANKGFYYKLYQSQFQN